MSGAHARFMGGILARFRLEVRRSLRDCEVDFLAGSACEASVANCAYQMPSSSLASSLIISGDQAGDQTMRTPTWPTPSSAPTVR